MPTTTSATSRISGFWTGGSSEVVSLYASACAVIADETAVRDGAVKTRGFSIRADQMVLGSAGNGRPAYGYPAPGAAAWITFGPSAGPLLVGGVDFSVSDDYVWFNADPILTAPVRYLTWSSGTALTGADGWWGEYQEPPPAVEPPTGTVAAMSAAIAILCDSPATGAAGEVVEDVWLGGDAYRVVTNIAGYALPAGDAAAVVVGDTLPLGSPLGTAWTLTRLGPNKPGLPYITTPASFHLGVTTAGITWRDSSVPTIIDTAGDRTRIRWALGGTLSDVNAFWAASHAYGTEVGARSLARAMDTRTGATDDPGPGSLPTYVNPLEFVCRELFGGTAYLLVVTPDKFGPDGETDAAARAATVRAAAGPHVTVIEYEGAVPQTPQTTPS